MGDVSDDNLRIELLSDVKAAFEEKTFISSAELVTRLCAREDRPWATFAKGKPINGHRLARLLKLFGVVPAQNPQRSAQGYYQDRLEDSWARYLPTKVSDRPNTNESWPKVTSSECPSPINPDTSKTQESSINPGSQDAWTLQNPDRTEDSMGQDYPLVRDILEVFPGTKVRVIE